MRRRGGEEAKRRRGEKVTKSRGEEERRGEEEGEGVEEEKDEDGSVKFAWAVGVFWEAWRTVPLMVPYPDHTRYHTCLR